MAAAVLTEHVVPLYLSGQHQDAARGMLSLCQRLTRKLVEDTGVGVVSTEDAGAIVMMSGLMELVPASRRLEVVREVSQLGPWDPEKGLVTFVALMFGVMRMHVRQWKIGRVHERRM